MMENMSRFHIRPARPDEAGLFYTPNPEEDKRRGTIGHVRMDFGRSGEENPRQQEDYELQPGPNMTLGGM